MGWALCQHVVALMPSWLQVMRLRDENEALMETLVRAKVELAETQGDWCPSSMMIASGMIDRLELHGMHATDMSIFRRLQLCLMQCLCWSPAVMLALC